MAIPDFNEIKLPALELLSDGELHRAGQLYDVLAKRFDLSPADLHDILPSGAQSRWHNRVLWACYDLFRAGLLERPRRGVYRITDLGRSVLAEKPAALDRDYLMRFPQFAEFTKKVSNPDLVATNTPAQPPHPFDAPAPTALPPEEQMAALAETLRQQLSVDLLEQIGNMSPFRFERLVLDLLLAMGYGGSREEAAVAGKGVNDGGIDGLINEDRLGLDRIYVQAKRWQDTVGRPHIQSFVGALAGHHAHKGVFITTGTFTASAVDYVRGIPQRVVLIDGERLAQLMIEHGIGVGQAYSHEIKRIDTDYFEQE